MHLFHELKRRNVLRAATAYIVASWLIIQVVETVFPAFGFGEAAVRIAVIVLVVGFVPAVVLAWAFELTPSGLKHEKDVDYSSPAFKQFGKRLDRIIMVVLALALGLFAFDKFVLEPEREASQLATLEEQKATEVEEARQQGRTEALVDSYGDKSIAVLPFDDMSAEGDQEYMSDGIAEELLNLLARVPGLRVISRSTAFAFKGQNLEVPEIANRLSVGYILEGSVRKSANRIRITAQLIEARSDTHIWSETYDRDLEDIFAIQDEVAGAVVNELKIKLLGDAPKVRQTNPQAYELYLQAKFLSQWVATEASNLKSVELAKQALEIDPGYVPAWNILSIAYNNTAVYRYFSDYESHVELLAKSREALRRAYELEPEDPTVLANMAFQEIRYRRDSDPDAYSAAFYLRRALELDPGNWLALDIAAKLLAFMGRFEEAVVVQEYLVWLEPLNIVFRRNMISIYEDAGRFQEALDLIQTQLEASPDDQALMEQAVYFKMVTGDAQDAIADADMLEDPVIQWAARATAYHFLGRAAESKAALAKLAELSESVPYGEDVLAQVYTMVGDVDAAFECLNGMVDDGTIRQRMHYNEPNFLALHDDPRWAQLMERLGISKDQYADIDFEVVLPARTPTR